MISNSEPLDFLPEWDAVPNSFIHSIIIEEETLFHFKRVLFVLLNVASLQWCFTHQW